MKAETSMESRFIHSEIETKLGRKCFIDSDDLRDLSALTQHVRDSDVLVLVQSQSVLTRPYCLLEILTAMDAGVPIVGVSLCKHAFPYCFEKAAALLDSLDTWLGEVSPGADEFLIEHGIDLEDAAFKCSSRIPKIISINLDTCASRNILAATMDDLVSTMASARPVPLATTKEEWLAAREQRRARGAAAGGGERGQHGRPFERQTSTPRMNAAALAAALAGLKDGSGVNADVGKADAPAADAPSAGVPAASGLWFSKKRTKKPRLNLPNPTMLLVERSDLPPLDDPTVVTLINGGHRIGPECEIESCCAFSNAIIMLLRGLGAKLHEYTVDLCDKPQWLKPIVHAGKPEDEVKITTPMMHFQGKWYTESADMIAALPTFFPEAGAKLFRPPPHLDPEHVKKLGLPLVAPMFGSTWESPDDHPSLPLWAPFEAALARAPYLGGETICDVDIRAASWLHSSMCFDLTLCGDGDHPAADWEEKLPNLCRWFEGGMLAEVRRATTSERRYQLLLAVVMVKEFSPALASRVPPEITEEIEVTRKMAKAVKTGSFIM